MQTDRPMGRPPFRGPRHDLRVQIDADVAERLREHSRKTGVPQWKIVQSALLAYLPDDPDE